MLERAAGKTQERRSRARMSGRAASAKEGDDMLAFLVEIDGQRFTLAGAADWSVLTCALSAGRGDQAAQDESRKRNYIEISVAGLSTQKIQELASSADTPEREAYEDYSRSSISGAINEFWTQEQYHVHFRIEKDKLSVSISDNTYSPRVSPSERSDGFQWYLSFYCALLNEATGVRPMVLLLDNPGLELHADGQRDIKRFLEEKLPTSTQVVYITHSPAKARSSSQIDNCRCPSTSFWRRDPDVAVGFRPVGRA